MHLLRSQFYFRIHNISHSPSPRDPPSFKYHQVLIMLICWLETAQVSRASRALTTHKLGNLSAKLITEPILLVTEALQSTWMATV